LGQFASVQHQPDLPKGRAIRIAAPPIVDEVQTPAKVLDGSDRDFAGSRLHYDFSKVRIHSDEPAGRSKLPQAQAFDAPGVIQAKVARGPADDPLEQQADRVGNSPTIHRLLTPPGTGRELPQAVRTSAERTLQWDFGAVRIHDNPQAGFDVNALGAVAVTHGHHIFLGMNAPPATSGAGWQLLLHELTHVRQQALASSYGRLLSEPGDAHERAADAMSRAPAGDTNHASGDGPVAALQRQTPGPILPPVLPPGVSGPAGFDPSAFNWTRIPGEGFGGAAGDVVVGGARLGAGQFGTAVTPVAVTGSTTTVAEGTVVVGGSTVGEGAVVVGGDVVIGTAAAVGIVVIGALIVAGTILLVASLVPQGAKEPKAGEEYPGTSLPGGAPTPASAPGQNTPVPGRAPGAAGSGPTLAPGVSGRTPALVPGPANQAPVTEPRPVDTPAECARLIKAGKTHDHHIFPWEYVNEFASIGIDVDDYTVTLNATEHIGSRGIHITMDWNGEWGDFFNEVPADLTPDQAYAWGRKAIDKAVELMNRSGIAWKKIHRFRKPQSVPPLTPPKSKS
jgi:hypothetical protein